MPLKTWFRKRVIDCVDKNFPILKVTFEAAVFNVFAPAAQFGTISKCATQLDQSADLGFRL